MLFLITEPKLKPMYIMITSDQLTLSYTCFRKKLMYCQKPEQKKRADIGTNVLEQNVQSCERKNIQQGQK